MLHVPAVESQEEAPNSDDMFSVPTAALSSRMGIPAGPHRVALTFLHEMGEAGRLEGTPGSCFLSLTGC